MNFNPNYREVATNVLDELRRYTGETYAQPFQRPIDVDHLAIAIQRHVEHYLASECSHKEKCKPYEE